MHLFEKLEKKLVHRDANNRWYLTTQILLTTGDVFYVLSHCTNEIRHEIFMSQSAANHLKEFLLSENLATSIENNQFGMLAIINFCNSLNNNNYVKCIQPSLTLTSLQQRSRCVRIRKTWKTLKLSKTARSFTKSSFTLFIIEPTI